MVSTIKTFHLVWDDWNKEHIKKHNVTQCEAEEVFVSKIEVQQSYKRRTMLFGETKNKRYLTVVVSFEKPKRPYVVSARDMSRKERKSYELATKTN